MLFFGLAIFLGLVVSSGLRHLRNPWIWFGALISLTDFPSQPAMGDSEPIPDDRDSANVARMKNADVLVVRFHRTAGTTGPSARGSHLSCRPVVLLRDRERASISLSRLDLRLPPAADAVLKGRIYYVAPVYPMLFAAGAVYIERQIMERNWEWAKRAILVPLAVGGIVAAPLAMPLLPVKAAAAYSRFLGCR